MDDIVRGYQNPAHYNYALKTVSPHAEGFAAFAAQGAEIIQVPPGERVAVERELSEHQLIVVRVAEGGRFEYTERASGFVSGKADLRVYLDGEGAEARIAGIYDVRGETKLDLYHEIVHRASRTRSRIATRGVLSDNAHVIYRSAIGMQGELANLEGSEDGRFLMLSPAASLDAVPALLTGSRAVNARHALSVSRPPAEELFYLSLRGLPSAEARSLFVEGFLNAHA